MSTKVDAMKNKSPFPTSMFATAALFSGLMVFVISAVFDQANEPCLSHYSSQHKVVVDTSTTNVQSLDTSKPLIMCNRNNQQISWLTWLFKRSESVEFHYLDLLELMSRK
jgi:hypothetical protein